MAACFEPKHGELPAGRNCIQGMCDQFALSCLTLCSLMDCSRSGSSVHRIVQAIILEQVAFATLRDLPKPTFLVPPALAGDSLPLSHQGSLTIGGHYKLHADFSLLGEGVPLIPTLFTVNYIMFPNKSTDS